MTKNRMMVAFVVCVADTASLQVTSTRMMVLPIPTSGVSLMVVVDPGCSGASVPLFVRPRSNIPPITEIVQ